MWNGIRNALLDSVPRTSADVEVLPQNSIIDLHRTIRKLIEAQRKHQHNLIAADHWLEGAKAEHEQLCRQEREAISKIADELKEAQDCWRKITHGDLGIEVVWPKDEQPTAPDPRAASSLRQRAGTQPGDG